MTPQSQFERLMEAAHLGKFPKVCCDAPIASRQKLLHWLSVYGLKGTLDALEYMKCTGKCELPPPPKNEPVKPPPAGPLPPEPPAPPAVVPPVGPPPPVPPAPPAPPAACNPMLPPPGKDRN